MMAAKTWNQRTRRLSHSRMDELNDQLRQTNSASPVSRVAVRTEEQRDVKIRFTLPYLDRYVYHRIERVNLVQRVIAPNIEDQPIKAWGEFVAFGQQLRRAAVLIGAGRAQQPPIAGSVPPLQADWNIGGRSTKNKIQNVG